VPTRPIASPHLSGMSSHQRVGRHDHPRPARLAIPEQFSDFLWIDVVKDGLTNISIEGLGIDCHAATAAYSLCVALHAAMVDRTQRSSRVIALRLAVQGGTALTAVDAAGK